MNANQALALFRRKVADAGGVKAFATSHGLSVSFVSDTVNKRRDLSLSTLAAIGLRRVVTYEPIHPTTEPQGD